MHAPPSIELHPVRRRLAASAALTVMIVALFASFGANSASAATDPMCGPRPILATFDLVADTPGIGEARISGPVTYAVTSTIMSDGVERVHAFNWTSAEPVYYLAFRRSSTGGMVEALWMQDLHSGYFVSGDDPDAWVMSMSFCGPRPGIDVPEEPELPEEPVDVPEEPELPEEPVDVPEEPELPEEPVDVPEEPELPEEPVDVPEEPELPEEPVDVPEQPELPEEPVDVPEMPGLPEGPELPAEPLVSVESELTQQTSVSEIPSSIVLGGPAGTLPPTALAGELRLVSTAPPEPADVVAVKRVTLAETGGEIAQLSLFGLMLLVIGRSLTRRRLED